MSNDNSPAAEDAATASNSPAAEDIPIGEMKQETDLDALEDKFAACTHEISPNGDVNLDLTTDAPLRIVVSSQIMSFCSPVFAKMLDSTFKEGLQNHHGPGRHRIYLPDDNAQAMLRLCRVFHHTTHEGCSKTLQPTTWRKLADLCDKYDCVNIMRPWLNTWIPYSKLPNDMPSLGQILYAAYTVDVPRLFSRVSWKMMNLHTGPFLDLPGWKSEPYIELPSGLLGQLPSPPPLAKENS